MGGGGLIFGGHHHHHHGHHHNNDLLLQTVFGTHPRPVVGHTMIYGSSAPVYADECKCVFEMRSAYQTIQVFDYPNGNVIDRRLVLDNELQFSTVDEKIYHQALIHAPMSYIYKNVSDVLVIGGGDGAALRELAKYKNIKTIDLIEIDQEVIQTCKTFFQGMAIGFQDPRVNVTIQDAYQWSKNVNKISKRYDLIVVDVTEETKNNFVLNSELFWKNILQFMNFEKHCILIRNGKHDHIRNYNLGVQIFINYYETIVPSFGGNYSFTMVSAWPIDLRITPINFLGIRSEINEIVKCPIGYPPEEIPCCVCTIL